MPSCDPEKPCDSHNQMNRRGGKSCRSRYTLPLVRPVMSGSRAVTCKGCPAFVDSRGGRDRPLGLATLVFIQDEE